MQWYSWAVKTRTTDILLGVIVILIIIIGFFFFQNKSLFSNSEPSHISGTFNINGVMPQGATISLTQKELKKNATATVVIQELTESDQGTWDVPDAVSGKSYELQALVNLNGKTIAKSDPLQVTAPADDETLVLNIPSNNPDNETAVISGNVDVNGYIPEGATIQVQGKSLAESEYTTIASGLPAKSRQFMSYTTAVSGTTYQVKGQMLDVNGNQIGSSSLLEVTAPALDEVLTINSKAQPPATPTPALNTPTPPITRAALSGSINFNGAAPANSRIVVFQRIANQGNFQVAVDNLSPLDGSTWQWNQAKNAAWYDIVAVLKQRQNNGTDQDIARSNTMTVAAPANNIQLSINSGISLPPPSGPISVTCNSQSGSNAWNTTVYFQSVSGAASYWFQLGTSNGGSDRLNQTQNAGNNPTQTVNPSFQSGTTYYARYAYANTQNAQVGGNEFSAFSATTSLICQ
jgi:hypothetical protein